MKKMFKKLLQETLQKGLIIFKKEHYLQQEMLHLWKLSLVENFLKCLLHWNPESLVILKKLKKSQKEISKSTKKNKM